MLDQETKQLLIDKAREARFNARVVKSGFRVGAALLTSTGEIITGCNVEIDNMLMSICAERTAIVKAISMGYNEFAALAVASDSQKVISPCGICRQFLLDFGLEMPVIMSNCDGDKVIESTVGELSPHAFLGSKSK